jgi:hypothetical protein
MKWIDVNNRNPDTSGDYLVFTGQDWDNIMKAYYMCGDDKWWDYNSETQYNITDETTHWMPLTEHP